MLAVRIPYNLIPSADRAAASTKVMDLTTQDYNKNVKIPFMAPRVSMVVLNGIAVDVYGNGTAIFSLAPGHVPARLGDITPAPNLLLEDQTQANTLAGLKWAEQRNPYSNIPLTMKGHNRAFDICPTLYGTVTGLTDYSGTIVPDEIDYTFSDGRLTVEISFIGETDESDAIYIDGDIPDGEGGFDPIPGGYGDFEIPDLPPLPPIEFPPITPPIVETDCSSFLMNFFPLFWNKRLLVGDDATKLVSTAAFPCKVKDNTYIDFSVFFGGDAADHVTVYAVQGGSRVLTATLAGGIGRYTFRAYFDPVTPTLVDGFEIELDEGFAWTPTASINIHGAFACTVEQVDNHIVSVQEQGAGNYAAQISFSAAVTAYIWLPPGFIGRFARVSPPAPSSINWVMQRTTGQLFQGLTDGLWTKPDTYFQYNASSWISAGSYTANTIQGDHKIIGGVGTSVGIVTDIIYNMPYYVVAGVPVGTGSRYVDIYGSILNNVCTIE